MKEFILHIGIHKTGTTSIQSALMNYNDGETIYASALTENNSIPLGLLFYPERALPMYKRMGKSFLDIFLLKIRFIIVLLYYLINPRPRRLIFSGEMMSIFPRRIIYKFIRILTFFGTKVRVICYVRNPYDFMKSAVCTKIISPFLPRGNFQPKYNLKNRIQPYIDCLGIKNVTIYNYDEIVKKQSIVDHFFSELDLHKSSNATDKNVSLSAPALALMNEIINRVDFKTPKKRRLIHRLLIKLMNKFINNDNGYRKLKKEDTNHLISKDRILSDLQWLKSTANINYEVNEVNNKDLDEIFNEYLNSIKCKDKKSFFNFLDFCYDDTKSFTINLSDLCHYLDHLSESDIIKYINKL